MIREFRDNFKKMSKHPYFSIVVFGVILILLQVLAIFFRTYQINSFINTSFINNLSVVLIAYIVSLGFSILLGYNGLASLGTGGFVILSTYTIAMLTRTNTPLFTNPISVEFAIIIAIGISLILGVIVGFISLRIEGMYLAIITLGISQVILEIFQKWPKAGAGTPISIYRFKFFGITLSQGDTFNVIFYLIVIVMVLLMIAMINIIKSPTGRAMLGMKNSTSASQAMGVSLLKYRLMGFILATFTAGLGGALHFLKTGIASTGMGQLSWSLNILAAVVIGGMKSIYGVFLGTFIVFGLNNMVLSKFAFFQTYTNAYLIFNGILIIVMVMFYPGGIVRLFTDIKNFILKTSKKLKLKWKEHRYGKDEE